ncbi:DUF302 domain-containing protein [Thiorhodococcus mannitoliphagus]|uniref:DUF302 domain-containing protein n=1 Tax=Thiorhodococcus mannitoliphagus TaxID=329406 RepID=A0A6P1DY99_9GAMM|nr:DUF302 domain-containing protein [Thiorhodococcus mannitoliphagus]NEX21981.1 DUF302 domain-containing protein [Thiorhodococcus mannitoliphagus]
MKIRRTLTLVLGLLVATTAIAVDGLRALESPYSAEETMDRLEHLVTERGLKVFARIDHAAGAASVGKSLRPTELLIFGNPKGGTPFMECAQTVAIDLPLKVLVWQDADGQVWLGYNEPADIGARHGVPDCAVIGKLSKALSGVAEAAVGE